VEPRYSYNFVIQSIGRVLRLYSGKKIAHIVLPCVYKDTMDFRNSPMMELLSNLHDEDNILLKLRNGRTSKIMCKYVKSNKTYNNINLGRFFETQQKLVRKGKLDLNKIEKLNNLDPNWNDDNWTQNYRILSKFCSVKLKLPICTDVYDGHAIGSFLNTQRT